MNFSPEVLANLTTLNMFHLRSLERGEDITKMHEDPNSQNKSDNKDVLDSEKDEKTKEMNLPKVSHEKIMDSKEKSVLSEEVNEEGDALERRSVPHRQRLREESVASYELLKKKSMDGLIIACKQHPTAILLSLLPYLAPSRPFVVFSPYKEPLMDAYMKVKENGRAVAVSLAESWLRWHQVLPGRTHPEVNMSGGGGYLLVGIYVDNAEPEFKPKNPEFKTKIPEIQAKNESLIDSSSENGEPETKKIKSGV